MGKKQVCEATFVGGSLDGQKIRVDPQVKKLILSGELNGEVQHLAVYRRKTDSPNFVYEFAPELTFD